MHTIRLRGPWQLAALERYRLRPNGGYERRADALPQTARATMPADWSATLGPDFRGRVRCDRTFQKPTGLEAGQRVWLVVEPPRSRGIVHLNGQLLGEVRDGGPAGRFDATQFLQSHNSLEIIVEHPILDESGRRTHDSDDNAPGGLIGEVRLEIEQ